MKLVLSVTLAFAAGVAVVLGANALETRPVVRPVVDGVALPRPDNVPNWKACLIREGGSLEKAYRATFAIQPSRNVFNRCLPEENAIIATMDRSRSADENQTLARGMMLAELALDLREENMRKAGKH